MAARDEIARLLREAAASMKTDPKTAVTKLESAFSIAREAGDDDDTALVAEELSRGWARRKSASRSLHYARVASKLAPDQRTSWTTLAKACELVASRTPADRKQRRGQALYRAAARAFKKAASLTKDAEDKRWLIELAQDAARQGEAR